MNGIEIMKTMDRNGLGEVFEPADAPRTTEYASRKRFKPRRATPCRPTTNPILNTTYSPTVLMPRLGPLCCFGPFGASSATGLSKPSSKPNTKKHKKTHARAAVPLPERDQPKGCVVSRQLITQGHKPSRSPNGTPVSEVGWLTGLGVLELTN